MTAKRPSGDTVVEAPLEKRGRLEETDMDDIDAELDDEVEKELREFEMLQRGLLGTTEDGAGKTGGTNRSHIVGSEIKGLELGENVVMEGNQDVENMEQDSPDGSDMGLDDLEQELLEARKKHTSIQQRTEVLKRSKHPGLNETPDTLAENNLLGDDLVEKFGILGDGEETGLDMEAAQLSKNSKIANPLPTQPETDSRLSSEKSLLLDPQELIRSAREILRSQRQNTEELDEDPNDPDFPSPKQKSKAKTNRSKSRRSQQCQSSPENQEANQELLTLKSPKKAPENRQSTAQNQRKSSEKIYSSLPGKSQIGNDPENRQSTTAQNQRKSSEKIYPSLPGTSQIGNDHENRQSTAQNQEKSSEKIYPSLPGTSRIGNEPSYVQPFVPEKGFVDPVLKIPVQPKSLCKDPEFRDPIFDHGSKPKDRHMVKVLPGISQSVKDSINERVLRVEQPGEMKIPEKPAALGQRHVRALDFDQPATQNNDPEVINSQLPRPKSPERDNPKSGKPSPARPMPPKHPAYLEFLSNAKKSSDPAPLPEEQDKGRAPSPGTQSDKSQPPEVTIDITYDQPVEYCVVERIIQRRFINGFLLDDEKLDMIEDDRPEIWCPDLFLYTAFYDDRKWLAACNELKRFFCWPCLFFASKVIWSVTCDESTEIVIGKEINKHQQSPVHQESIKQRDALMAKKKASIINELLSNNFVDGTWSDQNQEAIIMKGRPRPILDNEADLKTKKDGKLAFREFYDKFQWICGSKISNSFWCWPCLLFSREKWTRSGTIKSIEASLSLHETTLLHMDACFKLGKWEFDVGKKSEAEIRVTRNFLKCLVEILCAEKKKLHNIEFSPFDYMESLEIASRYIKKFQLFVDEKSKNSNITQICSQYTTAIFDSLEFFVKSSILEEIKSSNFVCLIFDHSSGLTDKAILSVIARYVDGKGQVQERFVKLLNVGYNTPFNMLIDEFFQIVTELQCRSTLVGFTYDGFFEKPGSVPDFNAKVQQLCPNAKFFHYPEHNFKRVLRQTLCHLPTCRGVLQAVNALASFFEHTPDARKGILDIVTAAEKSPCGDIWRSSNFIMTVFKYHAVIVEIMESIIKHPSEWKPKTQVKALDFLYFFKDSTNRFYITMMARLLDAVEDLSKEFDKDVAENLKTIASQTASKMQKLVRNFDNLVESACSHLEKSEQEGPRKEMLNLREQFSNVVRLVVKLVKNRMFGLESGYFKISNGLPTSSYTHFVKLKRQVLHNFGLPSNFSSTRLSKELRFFHNSSFFSGLDLPEIIALMVKYNMTQVLPELIKFLQLALTVPKNGDSTVPAVRQILVFTEGKKEINSADALIWMEKKFVSNLENGPNFYEQIADRALAITEKDSFVQSAK